MLRINAELAIAEDYGRAADERDATLGQHAAILRDLAGNPFRPDARWQPHEHLLSRDWWLAQIESLALAAYERRNPDGTLDPVRLAVLADALEEAGCTAAELLDHCRQRDKHVRGCWVVDLLLGKE